MRVENGFRQALETDETLFGAACGTFSPTVIELLGAVGFDFVWLDFEHGGPSPYDSTVFEALTRAAETGGIELLVRLPEPNPPLVRKVLDAGVRTILIPRVETAAELQQAVAAAHFSYEGGVGDRGVGLGRTSEWEGYVDSHIGGEDDQVLVGAMIENKQAVENIDDILAVPELGFTFVGPADLSMSLSAGDPLNKNPKQLQEAIDRTREACLDAGVPIGRIQNDPADAREAIEQGYQIVRIGGDTGAIRSSLADRLDAVTQ